MVGATFYSPELCLEVFSFKLYKEWSELTGPTFEWKNQKSVCCCFLNWLTHNISNECISIFFNLFYFFNQLLSDLDCTLIEDSSQIIKESGGLNWLQVPDPGPAPWKDDIQSLPPKTHHVLGWILGLGDMMAGQQSKAVHAKSQCYRSN